jgi:hypothetical protein
MLDEKKPESEDGRAERILDDAAERLAEVLIEHWEYQTANRKKSGRRSKPLAREGSAR